MLYVRVADAIKDAILEGRIGPGSCLPGTRAMAEMLGVNRRTVIAAVQRLEGEGWVVTEAYRGAVVAAELPSGAHLRSDEGAPAERGLGFDLPSLLQPVSTTQTGALLLADGAPDPRLAPGEAISRGYQRAMQRHGPALLQERDPMGNSLLREQIASWISERHGQRIDPDRILITRGSRSALALLTHTIFRKREAVLVESPGNRAAWDVFQSGAQMVLKSVHHGPGGVDLEAIQKQFRSERIRLLYMSARHQFPTGTVLAQDKAESLLSLAAEHRVAILEDDYDAEITFGERRAPSLLALDREGLVIHLGSLSRLIAPGLRIAFLVVPSQIAPFLASAKQRLEEQGDAILEWAIGDLIRDGDLARHLRRVRKIYQHRRDLLATLLRDHLGDDLEFEVPTAGMGLWLTVRQGLCAETWVRSARSFGLRLNPPSWFAVGEPDPSFRIGFAQADDSELGLAVERLVQARKTLN
jgi:GntR family transcriptional regulator/MocR family aminotransferase